MMKNLETSSLELLILAKYKELLDFGKMKWVNCETFTLPLYLLTISQRLPLGTNGYTLSI
jgi:hypothetical protein